MIINSVLLLNDINTKLTISLSVYLFICLYMFIFDQIAMIIDYGKLIVILLKAHMTTNEKTPMY
jgi:hypothetical protein